MQEHAAAKGDSVRIGGGHQLGQNLRRAGEDLKRGQIALKRGLLLRPAEIGLIASLGIGEVGVIPQAARRVLSTGDELRSIGTPSARARSTTATAIPIHGMLARLGCEAIDMAWCATTPSCSSKPLPMPRLPRMS